MELFFFQQKRKHLKTNPENHFSPGLPEDRVLLCGVTDE
jgi:hypothetical protein